MSFLRLRAFLGAMVLLGALGSAAAADGIGLNASYAKGVSFGAPTLTRVDALIGFPAASATAPAVGIPATSFSVTWQGQLEVPATGTYQIVTTSDDGVQVWVNRRLILDNLTYHGPTREVASIALEAGKKFDILVKYFQGTSTYQFSLRWIRPGTSLEEDIPTAYLYPTAAPAVALPAGSGTGLLGTYYKREDYSGIFAQRVDPAINFAWGYAAPMVGFDAMDWSIVWRGFIEAPVTDSYVIATGSAGSLLVYLDGTLILDRGTRHYNTASSATVSLVAGKKYPVLIKYAGAGRSAKLGLWWSSSSFLPQLIPIQYLYAPAPDTTPFVLAAPTQSRVSPVWVQGTCNSAVGEVSGTVDGNAVSVKRTSANAWYASSADAPLGLTLKKDKPIEVMVSAAGDIQRTTVVWLPTDLKNTYGMDPTVIRVGDQLLVTDSTVGAKWELDTNYVAASGFMPVYTAVPGDLLPISWTTGGTYKLQSRVDGKLAASITIQVVSVDFKGPIACEVGYQRNKDVGASHPSLVKWVAADPAVSVVGQGSAITGGQRIAIRPMVGGQASIVLQARLQTETGPVIAEQKVDQFVLRTSAQRRIFLEKKFDDGSMLGSATLYMLPGLANIDIKFQNVVSGVTFVNGTTTMTANTSVDFAPMPLVADGTWWMQYLVYRAPAAHAFCHSYTAYQGGVQVSF